MPDKGEKKEPERPGMEFMEDEFFADDVVRHVLGAAIEECDTETEECIPKDMEFIAASVPDGSVEMEVSITSAGSAHTLEIKP